MNQCEKLLFELITNCFNSSNYNRVLQSETVKSTNELNETPKNDVQSSGNPVEPKKYDHLIHFKTDEIASHCEQISLNSTNTVYAIRTHYRAINDYILLLIQQFMKNGLSSVESFLNQFLNQKVSEIFIDSIKNSSQSFKNTSIEFSSEIENDFLTLENQVLVF